jgi:hydrogenase maturation protease
MTRMVIGVGNPARGDDGVGAEVVRRLGSGAVATSPVQLLDLWEGADEVVVIDAARAGVGAGTIHRLEVGSGPLPAGVLASSTHTIGVAEVIELARALNRLPARVLVYGIEASDFFHGGRLSPEVEDAVSQVVAEVSDA